MKTEKIEDLVHTIEGCARNMANDWYDSCLDIAQTDLNDNIKCMRDHLNELEKEINE